MKKGDKFQKDEVVILDEGFANSSEVTVIRQTVNRLYTEVKIYKEPWDVMTKRLTKKK